MLFYYLVDRLSVSTDRNFVIPGNEDIDYYPRDEYQVDHENGDPENGDADDDELEANTVDE